MLAIAFDPSINNTGVCVALDGKVVYLGEIRIPQKWKDQDRLNELALVVGDLAYEIASSLLSETWLWIPYDLCLVESFERHMNNPYLKMMKASRAAGVIQGVMNLRSKKLQLISKGQIKKHETRWLAIDRGVITKDAPDNIHNALDAYQLLVCAGICK